MMTNAKQTPAFVTAKRHRPQNHYRFYYPSIKIRETNPFAHPTSSPRTFFRKTNPFHSVALCPRDLQIAQVVVAGLPMR